MKKLLPKTANNPEGFTLVELMVVITILAILALVGLTAFGEAQKRGRDGKRIQEIEAIAQALEIHYVNTGATPGYQPLVNTWFADATIPQDPQHGATPNYDYCLKMSTSTPQTCDAAIGHQSQNSNDGNYHH